MVTELLYADAHITGTFTNPNNALGDTPGTWAGVINENTSQTSRWSVTNPAEPLAAGATQTVNVLVRKGANSGDPNVIVNLWENGTLVSSGTSVIVTNTTTGQTVSRTFTTGAISRNQLEVEVISNSAGGNPSTRNAAQVARIQWSAETAPQVAVVSAPVLSLNGTVTQNEVPLAWTAVDDADDYHVYIDGSFYEATEELSTIVTGLNPDTSHDFTVYGSNPLGLGPVSNTVTVTTDADILGWEETTSFTGISTNTYLDETVTPGDWYRYRVAVADGGTPTTAWSEWTQAQAPTVAPTESDRFLVTRGADTLWLRLAQSQDIYTPDSNVVRAIIVVHGSSRNYLTSLDNGVSVSEGADGVLVVAPHFIYNLDAAKEADQLGWGGSWPEGGRSGSDLAFRVGSHEVIEELIAHLRATFTNLDEVHVAGHSAGGQFANRFSATHDDVRTKMLVANPASYLYTGPERWNGSTFTVPSSPPIGYDDYKYGLQNLTPIAYVDTIGATELRTRLGEKEVLYLVGTLDNDPAHPELDISEPAMLQGTQRVERAEWYYQFIAFSYGSGIHTYQSFDYVENVGHQSSGMIQSPQAREWLVGDLLPPPNTGGSPWTPSELTGKQLWLDASDTNTVTLVDGVVSAWGDKSAAGAASYDAVQTLAGQRPALTEGGLNGLPVLTFDGVDDQLNGGQTNLYRNVTGSTTFVVYRRTGGTGSQRLINIQTPSTAANRLRIRTTDTSIAPAGRTLDGDTLSTITGTYAPGPWTIVGVSIAYTQATNPAQLFVDGAVLTQGSWGTTGTTSDTVSVDYNIAAGSSSERLNGQIAEILAINASLSFEDRERVEGYLAHKWGLQASLPVSHTYKTDAPTVETFDRAVGLVVSHTQSVALSAATTELVTTALVVAHAQDINVAYTASESLTRALVVEHSHFVDIATDTTISDPGSEFTSGSNIVTGVVPPGTSIGTSLSVSHTTSATMSATLELDWSEWVSDDIAVVADLSVSHTHSVGMTYSSDESTSTELSVNHEHTVGISYSSVERSSTELSINHTHSVGMSYSSSERTSIELSINHMHSIDISFSTAEGSSQDVIVYHQHSVGVVTSSTRSASLSSGNAHWITIAYDLNIEAPEIELQYVSEVLADNPLSYWRLEETSGSFMADSAGTRDGTRVGGNAAVLGAVGSAVSFDGINDYINVGSPPNNMGAVSVEAIIKNSGDSIEGNQIICADDDGTAAERGWQFRVHAYGHLEFIKIASGVVNVTSTTIVKDNKWHHVVGTYDGFNMRIYVDGVLEGTSPATGIITAVDNPLRIGSSGRGPEGGNYFAGVIDEPAFYNYALPSNRIQSHYEAMRYRYDARYKRTADSTWGYVESIGAEPWVLVGLNTGTEYGAQFRIYDFGVQASGSWSSTYTESTTGKMVDSVNLVVNHTQSASMSAQVESEWSDWEGELVIIGASLTVNQTHSVSEDSSKHVSFAAQEYITHSVGIGTEGSESVSFSAQVYITQSVSISASKAIEFSGGTTNTSSALMDYAISTSSSASFNMLQTQSAAISTSKSVDSDIVVAYSQSVLAKAFKSIDVDFESSYVHNADMSTARAASIALQVDYESVIIFVASKSMGFAGAIEVNHSVLFDYTMTTMNTATFSIVHSHAVGLSVSKTAHRSAVFDHELSTSISAAKQYQPSLSASYNQTASMSVDKSVDFAGAVDYTHTAVLVYSMSSATSSTFAVTHRQTVELSTSKATTCDLDVEQDTDASVYVTKGQVASFVDELTQSVVVDSGKQAGVTLADSLAFTISLSTTVDVSIVVSIEIPLAHAIAIAYFKSADAGYIYPDVWVTISTTHRTLYEFEESYRTRFDLSTAFQYPYNFSPARAKVYKFSGVYTEYYDFGIAEQVIYQLPLVREIYDFQPTSRKLYDITLTHR